ncbi:MAG TPA: flippase [Rhodothermales bacterium]
MNATQSFERTVTRNFVALGAGELIARVVGFLTVIYIARSLGAEGYGVVGFASAVLLYFAGIADFGIEGLGPREVANEPDRLKRLVPTVVVVRLGIALVLAVAISAGGFVTLPPLDATVLALQSLTLVAVGLSTRWVFLGLEQAGRVALSRTFGEVLRIVLVVVFVRAAEDILLVPITQAIAETAAVILLLWWLHRRGMLPRFQWDFADSRQLFKAAFPIVITTLLGLAIYNSDLLLLRVFRGTEEIGFYLAAYTLIALLGNLSTAYGASLLPTLTRAGKTDTSQTNLFHTAIAHVFAAAVPIAVGGFITAQQIIDVSFGAEYAPSARVLQVLLLSVPFLLVRGVLQTVLISTGRQDRVMWITAAAAALNVTLNLLLISRYGMLGAAAATVATEIVRVVVVQVFVRLQGFSRIGLDRLWRTLFAAALMAAALLMLPIRSIWLIVPLGVLVYAIGLVLVGGIRLQSSLKPRLNL